LDDVGDALERQDSGKFGYGDEFNIRYTDQGGDCNNLVMYVENIMCSIMLEALSCIVLEVVVQQTHKTHFKARIECIGITNY